MRKILFFETPEFAIVTKITHTLAKAANKSLEIAFAIIRDNMEHEIQYAISEESPDILFSSFIQINPYVITVGKLFSLHVVVRNDYNLDGVTDEVRQAVYDSYSRADIIIAQTEQMRQSLVEFLDIDNSKIHVLENMLDEDDILEKSNRPNPFLDNGNFLFLWVGRHDPIKDLKTLYRAFRIIHNKYPLNDLTIILVNLNPSLWIKYTDVC